jgi:Aldo/keto reductase family
MQFEQAERERYLMKKSNEQPAAASGTFAIGGDLPVSRLGFGAMRVTGEGIWGPPKDKGAALAVLRRTQDLGINLIDTADAYGPEISESLIAEALSPFLSGIGEKSFDAPRGHFLTQEHFSTRFLLSQEMPSLVGKSSVLSVSTEMFDARAQ